MGRWAPDARGRLQMAAMELYGDRGFDSTTVTEIAARAGLTERTFFRHFADKREVMFSMAADLQDFLVRSVERAPTSLPAWDVIIAALEKGAIAFFEGRHQYAGPRQAIISAHLELQERELTKLASLAAALAGALRRRGVADTAASLAAEAGIAVFKIAFDRWTNGTGEQSLAESIHECVDELSAVTGRRDLAQRQG